MNASGLFADIKKHPWILSLVIFLHLALALMLGLNLSGNQPPLVPLAKQHNIIDAVVIDGRQHDDRKKQKKLAEQKKIADKKAAEKKAKDKKVKEKKAAEKKVAEKNQQVIEKKKAAEKKSLALAKKKEVERKEKQQRELKIKQEKAKVAAAKVVADKKAAELKEKQRLEAEKKRQRRAEEKAEFERALLAEERREEAVRKQAARVTKLQALRQQYVMLIAQKVENNWLRPASTSNEQSCEIIVTQAMTGDVIDVVLKSCTSNVAFQRSVERAVRKASPLPLPPDPELFVRKIHFTFKPR